MYCTSIRWHGKPYHAALSVMIAPLRKLNSPSPSTKRPFLQHLTSSHHTTTTPQHHTPHSHTSPSTTFPQIHIYTYISKTIYTFLNTITHFDLEMPLSCRQTKHPCEHVYASCPRNQIRIPLRPRVFLIEFPYTTYQNSTNHLSWYSNSECTSVA